MSYPILDAVVGLPHPELVTVYPDNSDPNLYYFVPTSVALVREGEDVRLGVQYWGLTGSDPAGVGAALTFSVEPAYDNVKVDEVAEHLKTVNKDARFAFPALTKSKMEVVLNGAFFPDKQDTTKPMSTKGGTVDATQAFSIALNGVGARAFAQGVAEDSDVLGARYTYSFLGIEKRLHAEITANYKKIYTHFSTAGSGSAWWGMAKANWSADWQKLRQNESIVVRILEGGETDTDEYMLEVFKSLVNAQINGQGIFKPILKPANLSAKPEAQKFGWGFSASTAWEKIDEEKNLKFVIDKQKLGEREFQVGLTFAAVCARYPDSFADLTTIGNQCIEKTMLKEVQQTAIKCLEAKLRRLKQWFDDGLMPQKIYEAEVQKAYDTPCYGEPGVDALSRNREPVKFALEQLKSELDAGRITATAHGILVDQIVARPELFDSPSASNMIENSIRTLEFISD